MDFFVVYCEENKTIFDFKAQHFISEKEINENCLLPSITFALKVTKFPHLFLCINHTGTLKTKKVKVEKITNNLDVQSLDENRLEVTW